MSRKDFLELLRELGRCAGAASWVRSQRRATPEELWGRCECWQWMTWLLGMLDMSEARNKAWALVAGRSRSWDARFSQNACDAIRSAVPWSEAEPVAVRVLAELRREK